MGMFDNLLCEYPLPLDGMTGVEWQTKDLRCELETYRITADGVLEVRFGGQWELALAPHWLIINFYSTLDYKKRDDGRWLSWRWVEFCAHFTHGKLDGLELVCDKIENAPTDEEIAQKRRETDDFLADVMKKYEEEEAS